MRLQPKVISLGLGASAMYLLDPDQGKRRRALVRDQLTRLGNTTTTAAGKAARDLGNRTRGVTHEIASRIRPDRADDGVLHDRVRARLGHVVAQPSAVEVTCEDGCCTLTGSVLPAERDPLLAAVSRVRGVAEVVDQLDVRDGAEGDHEQRGEGSPNADDFVLAPRGRFSQPALGGLVGTALLVAGGGLLLRRFRHRGVRAPRLPRLGARAVHPPHAEWPSTEVGTLPEGLSTEGDSLMVDGGEPLAANHPGNGRATH
jgi:hypothetical protein